MQKYMAIYSRIVTIKKRMKNIIFLFQGNGEDMHAPDANSNSNLGVRSFGVGCTNPNPNANPNPQPEKYFLFTITVILVFCPEILSKRQ